MVFESEPLSGQSWATKTYTDIDRVGAKEGSIAIIPVGSIEQHGHHLPVATDTLLVDAIAHLGTDAVANEIPVLVTPPVWTGLSPHHMSFGGTLTLSVETMLMLLEDVAESVLDNGFDALLFLNGHGGNMSLLGTAVTKIGQSHPQAELQGLTYFQLAESFVDEIRESEIGGMAHGGEFETSLMLHLYPNLVRIDDAEGTYLDDVYELRGKDLFEGGPLSVYRPFSTYSDSGAIGDPDLANAEKGRKFCDRLETELANLLRTIHEENR